MSASETFYIETVKSIIFYRTDLLFGCHLPRSGDLRANPERLLLTLGIDVHSRIGLALQTTFQIVNRNSFDI